MFRILSVVLVGCFLFASESVAMDDGNKGLFSTSKKRSKEDDKNHKKQKIGNDEITSLNNQSIVFSPTKAEKEFLSPIKKALAINMYRGGEKKSVVGSPVVRKTFAKFDNGTHFTGEMKIRGRRILQSNLFHHDDLVLHGGQWITNLQRMEMGLTPIGRNGILSEIGRKKLTEDEIYKIQNQNRIELHHITQKDTGEDTGEENPIVEMTYSAHHGSNTRLILERDPVSHKIHVVHSRLEKEQVDTLLQKHQFTVSNVLHFRSGPSLIIREEWNEVRSEYWKARAEEIKKRKEAPSPDAKFFLFKRSISPDADLPQFKVH